MLRQAWRHINQKLYQPLRNSQRKYQNHVWSEALAQLEKDCETCCPVPRFPEQKVTVIGAGTDIGRIACLFLKQQPVVKILAMYEESPCNNVMGAATDIAHIDTTTSIEAYQGKRNLRHALHNADVVLICGGCYPMPCYCNLSDRELFFYNQQYVRTHALAVSRFCSHAAVAVQTPPVDCNFALVKHTLEKAGTFDRWMLIGVNSVNAMRANQLYAAVVKTDPSKSTVPVICGTGRCTRVPVFSNTMNFFCIPGDQLDCLTRLVREADEIICKVKCDCDQGHLSIGFATARCVASMMKGLFVKDTFIDSALVEQNDPKLCHGMEICSTPITFGKKGIVKYQIPRITGYESSLLDKSRIDLEDMLNLGRCFALGEEYFLHPGKIWVPGDCEEDSDEETESNSSKKKFKQIQFSS